METNIASLVLNAQQKRILEIIESELAQEISPEMSFKELGVDSLDFICIIMAVREKVGPVSNEQAVAARKVVDILDLFQ